MVEWLPTVSERGWTATRWTLEKTLDRRSCDADIELTFHQRVRDAVVMAVNLDVIVDVDAGFLPFGVFVSLEGEWFEIRLFNRFKLRMARAGQFFERLVIEQVEELPDGAVEIGQSEESQFAQPRQHPTLDDLHADFDLRLVAGFVRARRQGRRIVVLKHLGISPGERGFEAAGFGDAALEIVRDDKPHHAPEEFEGADVRTDPIAKLLRESRFGVGVVRGAKNGDEDVCVADFAGQRVNDGNGRAAIVDEHFVARRMRLSHGRRKTPPPFAIKHAKVWIAVMLEGVGFGVLFPEKQKSDAFATQLLMKLGEVR